MSINKVLLIIGLLTFLIAFVAYLSFANGYCIGQVDGYAAGHKFGYELGQGESLLKVASLPGIHQDAITKLIKKEYN